MFGIRIKYLIYKHVGQNLRFRPSKSAEVNGLWRAEADQFHCLCCETLALLWLVRNLLKTLPCFFYLTLAVDGRRQKLPFIVWYQPRIFTAFLFVSCLEILRQILFYSVVLPLVVYGRLLFCIPSGAAGSNVCLLLKETMVFLTLSLTIVRSIAVEDGLELPLATFPF